MNAIYTDGSYQILIQNGRATLTNGTRTTRFPLRSPAAEIPAGPLAALKKQGADPADYFFVGTPDNGALLRRAALPAWEAAVASEKARKNSEKAEKEAALAAEISATGQKALMFWDAYGTKASLVIVRPAYEKEKIGLVGWYAEHLHVELSAMSIDRDAAQTLFQAFRLHEEQGNANHTLAQESVLWYLTDAQWDAFIAADRQAVADRTNGKEAAKKSELNRIHAAVTEAAHTGTPVEIERSVVECDGTQSDCSFDLIIRSVTGSGNIITARNHCH